MGIKTSTIYKVVPRQKRAVKQTQESLEVLRRAVSRSWKGKTAVSEIRSQRKRSK